MLTTQDKDNIRTTWAKLILPQADAFVDAFYAELFHIDPELRHLFPSGTSGMRVKLAGALAGLVAAACDGTDAERREFFDVKLQGLGGKHSGFGVRERDFITLRWAMGHVIVQFGAGPEVFSWEKLLFEATSAMIVGLRHAQGR
jgi:hemoglobin-like flavoprotein